MTARKRKQAPEGLSHASIAAAALQLVDDEGLEELSMRKLGRALGCEGMALYWYFDSKDALLDAVVDKLMESVVRVLVDRDGTVDGDPRGAPSPRPRANDWLAIMRDLAHAYRELARRHPNAFPLLATRRFASEGTYAFLDHLFELARRAGIDDGVAARFYRVISSYCNGFALNELATLRGPDAATTSKLRRKFPRVSEVAAHLEPKHLDELFEFGLELQLAALARATESR